MRRPFGYSEPRWFSRRIFQLEEPAQIGEKAADAGEGAEVEKRRMHACRSTEGCNTNREVSTAGSTRLQDLSRSSRITGSNAEWPAPMPVSEAFSESGCTVRAGADAPLENLCRVRRDRCRARPPFVFEPAGQEGVEPQPHMLVVQVRDMIRSDREKS